MDGDAPSNNITPLHEGRVSELLAAKGPISRYLPHFEARQQQQEMLKAIVRGYNNHGLTLIEAGTGTGKSMAYLLPALLWALQNKECTLVSTNTIALQEQLIHKDIPLLTAALQLDCKAVLVKGMGNYLCRRKLEEAQQEFSLLGDSHRAELQQIETWSSYTEEGCRSTLPFSPSPQTWEQVRAESDACNRDQCPHFKNCFFFKARRQASEAHLLIANHHMLFTDLAQRAETDNYKSSAVLPLYRHVILDEAHHLEEVATNYLAQRTHCLEAMRLLAHLATDSTSRPHGKLLLLKSTLELFYRHKIPPEIQKLLLTLNTDLLAEKARLSNSFFDAFGALQAFAIAHQPRHPFEQIEEEGSCSLRLLPEHMETAQWLEGVIPIIKNLLDDAKRYLQNLASLERSIAQVDDERLVEKTKSVCLDINATRQRLEKICLTLHAFVLTPLAPQFVRWIEIQRLKVGVNTHVIEASLDVAPLLASHFFNRFSSITLCSATLATNRQFEFCRTRLGLTKELLPNRTINEHIFESPFDFASQSLLVLPQDLPLPSENTFLASACNAILQALEASRGNAFILFTSYNMLRTCHNMLAEQLNRQRYHVCKQGDYPRHILLKRFRETDRSVLFGTDSFWEGVDVTGEALRCVIIAKLPFRVPSEPIFEARAAAITSRGGHPFIELSLPHAIVKFKQGFGRLIRQQSDRGCIVCLDHRIVSKNYGQQFLNSLPPCSVVSVPLQDIKATMQQFYRRTYHLTKKKA